MIALMGWIIAIVHYRDSMPLLVPTGDTLELLRQEIELVRQQFRSAVAPVIFGGGWDVLAAIGIALTVILSDAFAFRAFARAEALMPGGVLFVFIAALGADRSRVALATALVFAGVVATVALRAHHAPQRDHGHRLTTFADSSHRPRCALAWRRSWPWPPLSSGHACLALTLTPFTRRVAGTAAASQMSISPLVDIRSRLTNRSNAELFSVRADFASYWRLSALARFNGTEWGLPERSLTSAGGELSTARAGANELRQEITIAALGEKFVPTAPDPVAASPQDGLSLEC